MTSEERASDERLQDWRERALRVEAEVGKAVIGQPDVIRSTDLVGFQFF